MASLPSIAPLATGAFTAGPKDEMATVDIYDVTSSAKQTITSIQDTLNQLETSIFGSYNDTIGGLNDIIANVQGEIKFNANELSKRIMGTSSELKNSFRELSEGVKNNALVNTYKDKAKEVMCMVDDYKSMAKSANIGEVRALGNFINQYTGTKLFSGKDNSALGGLLGSVVNKASDLGVTGVFTTLTKTITDNSLISKIVKTALPIATKNGDFKLLRELSGSPAGKLINIFSPGFTNTLTRTFSQTRYSGRATLNTYDDVITSLFNVDNQWDILKRGDDWSAINIVSLIDGSPDFKNLMMAGISYYANKPETKTKAEYALATIYRKTTVYDDIRRYFPGTVIMDLKQPVRPAARVDVKPAQILQRSLAGLFSN